MSRLGLYIASKVFNEPWLISESAMSTITEIAMARAADEKYTREGIGECGEKVEFEGMEVSGGVARIPVSGVVVNRAEFLLRGMVDIEDLTSELDDAELRDDVERIEFHFDTPGGVVSGTPEFATRIFNCEKPTKAIVHQACSAGYWMASACDEIEAVGSTSWTGSIGVIVALADYSKLYENAGVKMEVFTSGDLKGTGVAGTSLSDSQRDYLNSRVDKVFQMFKSHVEMMRGELDPEVFRGQAFMSDEALKYNLIDSIKN